MTDHDAVGMDGEELTAFLGAGGTGTIAFPAGADEAPHAVPVSYGFDAAEGAFYFRLAVGHDSAKADVLNAPVTFVTHDEVETGWRSVVATGRLREVTEENVDPDALEGMRRVAIPLVDVFERPTREVAFRFFRLDPEELTGRKEAAVRE